MPSTTPFIDSVTGELDRAQVLSEAIPIGKLIGLFVTLSLVPFGLVFLALGSSPVGEVLVILGQFILAVGTGIVLMYVVARGTQLSGE
ncbi:hypothetical protein ACERIT_09350 [Halopenitus sp. H-Gu1]|uniref:hypothetical protein n=1 Tax=Halopenitus sp. H-Gu1 TaxID=3242697 RepID=UPI00359D014E